MEFILILILKIWNWKFAITRKLLNQLADLADEASETIYDDGKEDGTGDILKLCDELTMKIDEYLGN